MQQHEKKKLAVISARGEDSFLREQLSQLRQVADVHFHSRLHSISTEELSSLCEYANILAITRRAVPDFDGSYIKAMGPATGLVIFATGFEWIDLVELRKSGILVSNVPGYSTITVAEHTIGMMLTMSRRLHVSVDRVLDRVPAGTSVRGSELHNKSLGIIGYGCIGKAIAKLARGFGMSVHFFDPLSSYSGDESWELKKLLSESEFVVLAAPQTRGEPPMISKPELAMMRRGAYLINPARASLVDNHAVVASVGTGHLAGYAVDDKDKVLSDSAIEHGRILQTGHTAWYSDEAIARGTASWVANMVAMASSQPINLI